MYLLLTVKNDVHHIDSYISRFWHSSVEFELGRTMLEEADIRFSPITDRFREDFSLATLPHSLYTNR